SHHAVHAMWRHACAGASASSCGIRGGHVRIRAMINVQKRALSAFKQDLFSMLKRTMQIHYCVRDEWPQLRARQQIIAIYLRVVNRSSADRLKHAVVFTYARLQLL